MFHLINYVYRNSPLNFHCTALWRHYVKALFSPGQITKTKAWWNSYISGWTMGAYAEVFLYRKSWHWALPSCALTQWVLRADSGGNRKHVWMCGCSRNVFARSGLCVYVTWNVVVNGHVCLCSARVARTNEQTHTHTLRLETSIRSVTPSFWHVALWITTFPSTGCALFRWYHWL